MRRSFVPLVVVVFALAEAGGAVAAPPTVQSLQRQVTALQKQVKTLQKQMKQTQTVAIGVGAIALCDVVVTADTFQSTWATIDQLSQSTQGKPAVGPTAPVTDPGVCSPFNVLRSSTPPPNLNGFTAILRPFQRLATWALGALRLAGAR